MHYSSLNSPENNFKLFIAHHLELECATLTHDQTGLAKFLPRCQAGASAQKDLFLHGSNASHSHLCLIQRTVSTFAHAGNIGTSYCSVSHTQSSGLSTPFPGKNVFYREVCIEIFSYVSSYGMSSTCIALAMQLCTSFFTLRIIFHCLWATEEYTLTNQVFLSFFLNLLSCT